MGWPTVPASRWLHLGGRTPVLLGATRAPALSETAAHPKMALFPDGVTRFSIILGVPGSDISRMTHNFPTWGHVSLFNASSTSRRCLITPTVQKTRGGADFAADFEPTDAPIRRRLGSSWPTT
ncbi:hypothetical protein FTUN_5397 [Frigoriglobus tundricola]|uniref:Uncharacterized protein n=1 Tax=Frigoriglobus tundricola TaxID=2774151 RepID=A0A6M5YUP3_9BACT|nr:hypothetical protein FTUN_5397 [Frigoriglobus tundricola]